MTNLTFCLLGLRILLTKYKGVYMSDEFVSIYEKPFRPLASMTKKECDKELQQWRDLWTWHEELLTYWLTHINSGIKVKQRNFQTIDGILRQPRFELVSVDVETIERIYNYARGEATYEHKVVTIPISGLVDFAFVIDKEVIEETFEGKAAIENNAKLEHELE